MLNEPITIFDYDPAWSERFEQEKAVIISIIGEQMIEVEHFGSTAVPGLAAKPIVDILIGLKQYPMSNNSIYLLESIGYEYLGEAGISGRLYFRKRQPFAFNLGAVEWNSRSWKENLLLRDYLRSHPDACDRYEQHKRAIIDAGCSRLLEYSEQKAQVVADLLRQAEEWQNRANPNFSEKSLTVNTDDSK